MIFFALFPFLSYCSNNEKFVLIPSIILPIGLYILTVLIERGCFVVQLPISKHKSQVTGYIVDIRRLVSSKNKHKTNYYLPLVEYEWNGVLRYWNSNMSCTGSFDQIGRPYTLEVDSVTGVPVETKGSTFVKKIGFIIAKILWIMVLLNGLYMYYLV